MALNTNGWPEWARYLLNRCDSLAETQANIRADIAGLKVKSGVWGAVGGMIPVSVALVVLLVAYVVKKVV